MSQPYKKCYFLSHLSSNVLKNLKQFKGLVKSQRRHHRTMTSAVRQSKGDTREAPILLSTNGSRPRHVVRTVRRVSLHFFISFAFAFSSFISFFVFLTFLFVCFPGDCSWGRAEFNCQLGTNWNLLRVLWEERSDWLWYGSLRCRRDWGFVLA